MAALKDLLSFIDDKLGTEFNKPEFDPEKARAPLIKGIDRSKEQFEQGKTKVPHRWWSVNRNVVEFEPRVKGNAIEIGGKPLLYIPAERFVEFLASFKAHVEAGQFDKQLEEMPITVTSHMRSESGEKPVRARREGGGGREWTPERRAAYQATIAARKAAKETA